MLRALLLLTAFIPLQAFSAELRLAVASNFLTTAEKLASAYEQETGHEVIISSGSTGKLYTQIRAGAPFDLFLAADAERPERLVNEGYALPESRVTYALGQLAIWSRKANFNLEPEALLRQPPKRLALANAATAPYGRAAEQAISYLGLTDLPSTQVRGENISQTYQLVYAGAAEVGFIAYSLYTARPSGTIWQIPTEAYDPIEQQMVVLKRSTNLELAHQWHAWMLSEGRKIIAAEGYALEASNA